jgi:transcriptional regulator
MPDTDTKTKRGRPRRIDYDKFREMWEAGVPTSEIAEALGSTTGSIQVLRHRIGLTPRRVRLDGQPCQQLDHDRIREMWLADVSVDEIANALGTTKASIWSMRRHLELPPRVTRSLDSTIEMAAQLSRAEREELIVALQDLRLLDD